GAVAACVMGMATKEVMVTAPLLLWLYDWMFVGGSWSEVWRQRWRFHAGMMVLGWGVLAAIMLQTNGSNLGNVESLIHQLGGAHVAQTNFNHDVPWLEYARIQPWAMARYLCLSFWPSPLVFAYGADVARSPFGVVASTLLMVLLLATTVVALARRHWTGYAGAWFFLILAPTSSVVPLSGQMVAEHRMYLPLAAVMMLWAVGAWMLGLKVLRQIAGEGEKAAQWAKGTAAVLMTLLLVCFGKATMARNADYRTSFAIWTDTVSKWPGNAAARSNVGLALHEMGRDDEAIAHFEKALSMDPRDPATHYNLAIVLLSLGSIEQAIEQYREVVALRPESTAAHNNLGEALLRSGRPDEAMEQFQKVIEVNPHFAGAENNLGNVFLQMGRWPEAISHYEKALEIDPDSASAHSNLGSVLLRTGRFDDAITHYERALELRPDFVDAHNNLAAALQQKGRFKEALAHLEEGVKRSPEALGVSNNLALFLATSDDASLRDGARALKLAQRVNQRSGGNRPEFLHTLAAAYAETGKFIEADETAERAQSLAMAQGDPIQAEVIRNARKLYQAGKPLRHAPPVEGGEKSDP
ncbi:MAG TPA: tetratricopeptide repeat protein, partial [Verrucomicrobiaceae bacterium]